MNAVVRIADVIAILDAINELGDIALAYQRLADGVTARAVKENRVLSDEEKAAINAALDAAAKRAHGA